MLKRLHLRGFDVVIAPFIAEGRARGAQNDCISRLQDVAQRIARIGGVRK